jgi:hypothetical protein
MKVLHRQTESSTNTRLATEVVKYLDSISAERRSATEIGVLLGNCVALAMNTYNNTSTVQKPLKGLVAGFKMGFDEVANDL